jgi:hypothetical protein
MAAGAVAVVAMLVGAPAFAQTPVYPYNYPYGLDPFRPTDAALLRQYGSVLVAQTPLLELARLDPFRPTDAALLRDLGGGLPLWGWWYPPVPSFGGPTPFAGAPGMTGPVNLVVVTDGQARAGVANSASASTLPLPQKVVTVRRPPTNDGAYISYGGMRWLSGGPAVPYDEAAFTEVGQYEGFPVFRRNDTYDEVIYLPVRQDLVAPFRMKSR